MEKRKFEKVKETLTKTEEELKDLKKVCSSIAVSPYCVSIEILPTALHGLFIVLVGIVYLNIINNFC